MNIRVQCAARNRYLLLQDLRVNMFWAIINPWTWLSALGLLGANSAVMHHGNNKRRNSGRKVVHVNSKGKLVGGNWPYSEW